jgi:hypothetical protein
VIKMNLFNTLLLAGALLTTPGCSSDSGEDPGRITMHRLNRAEYNNTVRDLMKTELKPANDFPLDDHGYGFDNIADVLSLSGLQIELYHRAAVLLTDDLFRAAPTFTVQPEGLESVETGSSYHGKWWSLWEGTPFTTNIEAREDGEFVLSLRAFGRTLAGESPRLKVELDGAELTILDVTALEADPNIFELAVSTTGGSHELALTLLNPQYDTEALEFRRVMFDWVKLEGPMEGIVPSSARSQLITCELTYTEYEECARTVLSQFANLAYRRPVTNTEITALVELVKMAVAESDHPEVGLANAMQAVLISPHFIFRVELDEDPTSLDPHDLSDYELASRLSYFIWSSMPDETLLDLAAEGNLNDKGVLATQVDRMLSDSRSQALVDNFAGQWLYTRAMKSVEPEPNTFPDFDDELAVGLQRETAYFFKSFLDDNTPIEKLLTADFTYLNERVATHYGIEGVTGSEMRRVDLAPDDKRGGLLTQGSLLTVTSYPARTSPVQRGKWVLQQMLCDEPAPPPPGVEGLVEELSPTASLRERLEQHRAAPVCAACHEIMDPIGFALEHFNAVGQWREDDDGYEIDDSGLFPDGTTFTGAFEMADVIKDDPKLRECVAEHMYTYAMGRGIETYDAYHLEEITESYSSAGGGLRELIREIVQSESFRKRRGDESVEVGSEEGVEQ